jgi:hypothetical protein
MIKAHFCRIITLVLAFALSGCGGCGGGGGGGLAAVPT